MKMSHLAGYISLKKPAKKGHAMRILSMSTKELKRMGAIEGFIGEKLSRSAAAKKAGCSERTISRSKKRYKVEGYAGLRHRRRGCVSNRATAKEFKQKVLDLMRTQYEGFGPTFAAEKLEELEGIKINDETLRLWMIADGLWKKKRQRLRQRKWRERKQYYGEMQQFDGSEHLWTPGVYWTLLKFIDDATGRVFQRFYENESYQSVADLTIRYIEKYGKPVSIYTDRGSVYKVTTNNHDGDMITQYQMALNDLAVELIHANSPQAKGRVERSFNTDQDRLVKELKLRGITTIDEANTFLENQYNDRHNAKFARIAAQPDNLHGTIGNVNLNKIFTRRTQRNVMNDWTIKYCNRLFQLDSSCPAIVKPKNTVIVHEQLDGIIFISIRKQQISFKEIGVKPQVEPSKTRLANPVPTFWRPTVDHPWKRNPTCT